MKPILITILIVLISGCAYAGDIDTAKVQLESEAKNNDYTVSERDIPEFTKSDIEKINEAIKELMVDISG